MLYHLVRRCDKMWKTTCHNLSHDVTRKKMHRTQDATSCDAPMQNGQQDVPRCYILWGSLVLCRCILSCRRQHLLASYGRRIFDTHKQHIVVHSASSCISCFFPASTAFRPTKTERSHAVQRMQVQCVVRNVTFKWRLHSFSSGTRAVRGRIHIGGVLQLNISQSPTASFCVSSHQKLPQGAKRCAKILQDAVRCGARNAKTKRN
eukprot:gene14981-biopygen11185